MGCEVRREPIDCGSEAVIGEGDGHDKGMRRLHRAVRMLVNTVDVSRGHVRSGRSGNGGIADGD